MTASRTPASLRGNHLYNATCLTRAYDNVIYLIRIRAFSLSPSSSSQSADDFAQILTLRVQF
eukprot:1352836-Heterocapsa_arctica.AAC.1